MRIDHTRFPFAGFDRSSFRAIARLESHPVTDLKVGQVFAKSGVDFSRCLAQPLFGFWCGHATRPNGHYIQGEVDMALRRLLETVSCRAAEPKTMRRFCSALGGDLDSSFCRVRRSRHVRLITGGQTVLRIID